MLHWESFLQQKARVGYFSGRGFNIPHDISDTYILILQRLFPFIDLSRKAFSRLPSMENMAMSGLP